MKYTFPVLLQKDESHLLATFPDLPECFTEGDTLQETLELAADVLAMMLTERENAKTPIPAASSLSLEDIAPGQAVAIISADTLEYRKRTSGRAVKKTLTIPAWLNDAAESHSVNYSQLLQEALIKHLHLE